MRKRPIVALALGGGGALGFAHIGVIDILQKNNIPIDIVVGTSMGAVVGAIYCNGASIEDMEKMATNIKTRQLLDVSLGFQGLISGNKAMNMLKKILPKDKNIEDLPVKFACNAVDIVRGKEVVFEKGNILKSLRASMSVPGIFVPVRYEGMTLVDGGVLNNLPHDIARRMGADIVIAVDVVSSSEFSGNPRTAVGIIARSWLIAQQESQNNRRKFYNVKITPNMPKHRQHVFDDDEAKEIINEGRIAAQKSISKISELIENFKFRK